jgi:hypothetical protein
MKCTGPLLTAPCAHLQLVASLMRQVVCRAIACAPRLAKRSARPLAAPYLARSPVTSAVNGIVPLSLLLWNYRAGRIGRLTRTNISSGYAYEDVYGYTRAGRVGDIVLAARRPAAEHSSMATPTPR